MQDGLVFTSRSPRLQMQYFKAVPHGCDGCDGLSNAIKPYPTPLSKMFLLAFVGAFQMARGSVLIRLPCQPARNYSSVAVLECNYRSGRRSTSEPLGGILKQPCPYLFCKAATTTTTQWSARRSAGFQLALLGRGHFLDEYGIFSLAFSNSKAQKVVIFVFLPPVTSNEPRCPAVVTLSSPPPSLASR